MTAPSQRRASGDVIAEVERHRGALPDGPVAADAPLSLPVPLEPTHYALLGLDEQAGPDAIDHAIAALRAAEPVASPRPAVTSGESRQLAAAVLGDPLRKAVYDAWLARERAWLNRVAPPDPAGRLMRRLRLGLRWLPLLLIAVVVVGLLLWLWPTA